MVGNVLIEGFAYVGYVSFRFPDVLSEVAFPNVVESTLSGDSEGYVWPPAQSEGALLTVDEDSLRPGLIQFAGGVGVGNNAEAVAAAAVSDAARPVDGFYKRGRESGWSVVHWSAHRHPSRGRFCDRFSDRFVKTSALE